MITHKEPHPILFIVSLSLALSFSIHSLWADEPDT